MSPQFLAELFGISFLSWLAPWSVIALYSSMVKVIRGMYSDDA